MLRALFKRGKTKFLFILILIGVILVWLHLNEMAINSSKMSDIHAKIRINLNVNHNHNNLPFFNVKTTTITTTTTTTKKTNIESKSSSISTTAHKLLTTTIITSTKISPPLTAASNQTMINSSGIFKGPMDIDDPPDIDQQDPFIDLASIRNSSIVFIGGYGRSGTTLMRALLDVHPNIRCGPETKIVPSLLGFMKKYLASRSTILDLKAASVLNKTIDEAIASFVYHVIVNHGPRPVRLCVKDPEILYYTSMLHSLFPNAKFIYMIRDGRAAAISFMERTHEPLITNKFRSFLYSWNIYNKNVYQQCDAIGRDYCMRVKYEDLIMETNKTLVKLMTYLNESWTDRFLNHHEYIGTEISVSKLEWSTDQINKPINKSSLDAWMLKAPFVDVDVVRRMAPLIETFGYSLQLNYTIIDKQIQNAKENLIKYEEMQKRNIFRNRAARLRQEAINEKENGGGNHDHHRRHNRLGKF